MPTKAKKRTLVKPASKRSKPASKNNKPVTKKYTFDLEMNENVLILPNKGNPQFVKLDQAQVSTVLEALTGLTRNRLREKEELKEKEGLKENGIGMLMQGSPKQGEPALPQLLKKLGNLLCTEYSLTQETSECVSNLSGLDIRCDILPLPEYLDNSMLATLSNLLEFLEVHIRQQERVLVALKETV